MTSTYRRFPVDRNDLLPQLVDLSARHRSSSVARAVHGAPVRSGVRGLDGTVGLLCIPCSYEGGAMKRYRPKGEQRVNSRWG
jgi:hypothetical protein